jgi:hypothetical protein
MKRGWLSSLTLALLALSCRGPAEALAPTPDHARADLEGLLGALAARFGPMELEPAFDALRPKLLRAALAPSRVFGDASAWTRSEPTQKTVEFAAERQQTRYRMGIRLRAAAPSRPADYRGVLRLRRDQGSYEWTMQEELAVGAVTPAGLSRALTSLYRVAERVPEAEAHRRLHEDLPRTTAALGRLFSLDALTLRRTPDGATAVGVAFTMNPATLEPSFPRYARYLQKYLSPMSIRLAASDESGDRWWEARFHERRVDLDLRVHGGDLAPLAGPPRSMPDALRLTLDYTTRVGPLRVGVRGLEAQVVLTREPHEQAFLARFRKEPEWQLPFLLQGLLRASLRRPFDGTGSSLAFAIREGPPTLITRDYRVVVQETWIVRWIGGLMDTAVKEFRRGVEEEADRFSAEALTALQADLVDLLRPAR